MPSRLAMLGAPIMRRFRAALPGGRGVGATGDAETAQQQQQQQREQPSHTSSTPLRSPRSRPTLTQRFQDFFPWKDEGHRLPFFQRFLPAGGISLDMPRKTKPTSYPHLPFHGLRATQLLSSVVVMSILSYFLWNLHHDGYGSPWTFILLLTVSVLTILSLSVTIVLHLFYGLNPRLNVALNGGLLFIWSLGFALLSWWSSSTLGHACNVARWENGVGIRICQMYKALFAFSMFGFLSTLGAALLDIYVYRRANVLGSYNQMQDLTEIDQKVARPLPSPRRFQENNEPYDSTALRSPLPETSTAYDPPKGSSDGSRSPYEGSTSYDPPKSSRESSRSPFEDARVSHDTPKPSAEVLRTSSTNKKGYAVPEEQFRYDQ